MHLCFVDESGTPPKLGDKSPGVFVMAAVIIPDAIWHTVQKKLVGLKASSKYHGEVKWRFFAPNNTDEGNPMKGWAQDQRNEFRNSVFKIITDQHAIRLLACICDCGKAYSLAHVNTQDDIYFQTYKPITERFQYFLQDISKSTGERHTGIIVADHRGSKDDAKMRQQHDRLVGETTKYTSSYANFVEGLFFTPSHMSIGVQLADMVAGATWRSYERGDDSFLKPLRSSFRSKPGGVTIEGYGLVRYPNK